MFTAAIIKPLSKLATINMLSTFLSQQKQTNSQEANNIALMHHPATDSKTFN